MFGASMSSKEKKSDESDNSENDVGFDFEVDKLPNVAELFDLFPYVMYYTGPKVVDQTYMHEFKYSYPLGKAQVSNDAELLLYFNEENNDNAPNMILNTIILRANSLNITDPFKLYAAKPIKE